jgi:tetratricopeptide (TPR) repeat protein
MSNTLDKISFWSLFLVIVLLPVFILPFTQIPVETSKGLLLVVGLVVSVIFWMAARLSEKKVNFPKSTLLLSGVGVVLIFLLASIFSKVPQVSFFGTMLDIGSFWFILCCFLLMFLSSVILRDSGKAKSVLFGTLLSFMVVLVFQGLRFLSPGLSLGGVLIAKTDNILGSWNTLGLFAGFASTISLFLIEFVSISKAVKWMLGVCILLSLVLVAAVNFSLIWVLVGVFALLIFIYKVSFHSGLQHNSEGAVHFPVFSLGVVIVSLLFFVSSQFLGGFLPNHLGVTNTEITPSFSATMLVTKAVLVQRPILGVGPNEFGQMWALYKPANINATQFWNVYFQSGFGLLPTLTATTGILGILAWLLFFFFLIKAGMQSIFSNSEGRMNFDLALFFVAAIYLFIASFLYSVGSVIFLLAFVFTGVFIGLSSNRDGGVRSMEFSTSPRRSFPFIFTVVLLIIISAGLGFKYIERFVSIPYFAKALSADTIPVAEASIQKAVSLNPNDLYLRTYAQIYLIKFSSMVNEGSSLSDQDKSNLQATLNEAVNAATLAASYDSGNYLNFQTLGYVYSTVGQLGVSGAYDKAIAAYTTASNLNPVNPQLKLSIAEAYLAQGNTDQAKIYANQALTLKPDYSDAYSILSQIAKSQGDNATALSDAQKALSLSPGNKDLENYINSLNTPSAPPATPPSSKNTSKKSTTSTNP